MEVDRLEGPSGPLVPAVFLHFAECHLPPGTYRVRVHYYSYHSSMYASITERGMPITVSKYLDKGHVYSLRSRIAPSSSNLSTWSAFFLDLGTVEACAARYSHTGSFGPHWRAFVRDQLVTISSAELAWLLEQKKTKANARLLSQLADPFGNGGPFTDGLNALLQGDYDAAVSFFTEDLVRHYMWPAGSSIGKQAASFFTEDLVPHPESVLAWTNRGVAYQRAGRIHEAITDFTMAIKYRPDFALASFNRGSVYREKGDCAAASMDLRRAAELASGSFLSELACHRLESLSGAYQTNCQPPVAEANGR